MVEDGELIAAGRRDREVHSGDQAALRISTDQTLELVDQISTFRHIDRSQIRHSDVHQILGDLDRAFRTRFFHLPEHVVVVVEIELVVVLLATVILVGLSKPAYKKKIGKKKLDINLKSGS